LATLEIAGGGKQLRAGDIQSLLILPFENYTGDDQLDQFVAGMHASLIQDMGRISSFDVLNRTSSKYYKTVDMTLQEIASDLDRDAVIKAEVMCLGDTICFRIEVIRPFPKEKTLWIGEFREERSQIPNLYNRLTKQIADEVKIELTAEEDLILAESQAVDTAAYASYIKGLLYLDAFDKNALQKASDYFKLATKIEPDWAPPYAGLARVGASQMQSSIIRPSVAIPKIYENLNKALELDPNSSDSHYAKAVIAVWTEWNWKKGEQEFVKSLELNPSNALCRAFYAHLLMILHRHDEAFRQADLALKLDPYKPFIRSLCVGVAGDSAIQYHKKTLSIDPNHRLTLINLSVAYRNIGEYEKWFELWREITRYDDEVIAEIDKVFQEQGYLATIEKIIKVDEEAANEKQIHITGHVNRYLELNQYDKAMDWLEKGYEIHHPNMPYISTRWDQLKDNPRYIELLKKMNLPLPED
jgi:TolB-like protein